MFTMKRNLLILAMLYLGTSSLSSARQVGTYMTSREDVLAQREERKTTLENLLFDARQQLKDHQSGTNILTDDELADYVQKVEIFAKRIRKLSLQPSEMEIEHILEREKKKRMAYEDKLRRQEEL